MLIFVFLHLHYNMIYSNCQEDKFKKGGEKMKISETQEKARQARNLYYRKWRAANKEKVKEINARYCAKKWAELSEENTKK